MATELANSAPGVWCGVDKLPDTDAVTEFLAAHALPAAAPVDLAAVHALRERVVALLDDPAPERLIAGATALTAAVGGLTVVGAPPQWAAEVPDGISAAELLGVLCGVGILGVLVHLGPDRFRPCASDTCSGSFIDTSRARAGGATACRGCAGTGSTSPTTGPAARAGRLTTAGPGRRHRPGRPHLPGHVLGRSGEPP